MNHRPHTYDDDFGQGYDPFQNPEWVHSEDLSGVRTARIFAFFIDYFIIFLWTIPLAMLVGFIGIFTFGLGWLLYGILPGAVAFIYVVLTLSSHDQATPGMRIMNLRLKRLDGLRIDPFLAALHILLFWLFAPVAVLLLVSLISSKKRLLHDILLGTYMVRG